MTDIEKLDAMRQAALVGGLYGLIKWLIVVVLIFYVAPKVYRAVFK